MANVEDQGLGADVVHPDAAPFDGWSWREPTHGEHFRRCSFCGSVNPDDLLAEPFWTAKWADQKYGWPHKFYVDIPNREPEALFVVSATTTERPPEGTSGWVAWADLTPDQLAAATLHGYNRGDYRPTFLIFGTRANHFGKFYSVHLSAPALAESVRQAIERQSGIAFEFLPNGRVSWRSA
ncbi:hypothetical protein CLV43_114290 [Umezawaea tangerina]|uniref:Uncharacterized protein n=1 Tax=Umezawaea tangerina TaxID=84725 RepID=A0A2T0SPM2_9PSEU|nr:hypothetical protein CLV43_114290 [Umezawaea tangerina]